MVNVKELRNKSVSEIIKILKREDVVRLDLVEVGRELKVFMMSNDFSTSPRIDGEKIICAFVTNEKGNSCIFYSTDLLEEKEFHTGRIMITHALAKWIITGDDNFSITQSSSFSNREKTLLYELLMPERQVKEMVGQLRIPTTLSLAKIFDVSQEFVRERLDEMHIETLIVGYNY